MGGEGWDKPKVGKAVGRRRLKIGKAGGTGLRNCAKIICADCVLLAHFSRNCSLCRLLHALQLQRNCIQNPYNLLEQLIFAQFLRSARWEERSRLFFSCGDCHFVFLHENHGGYEDLVGLLRS